VSRDFEECGATPREAPEIGNAHSSRRTPDPMQRIGQWKDDL